MSTRVDVIALVPPVVGTPGHDMMNAVARLEGVRVYTAAPSHGAPRGEFDPRVVQVEVEGAGMVGALNLAASLGDAPWLLILEGPFAVEPATVTHLLGTVVQSGAEVVGILDRRAYSPSGTRALVQPLVPGGAWLLPRDTFFRLRGGDESLPFVVAMPDLARRAELAGIPVRTLSGELNCAVRTAESYASPEWDAVTAAEVKAAQQSTSGRTQIYVNLRSWSVPPERRRPLVSVAISTRNRGEFLRDALNSVLIQTFQDFEIVVVDDGSEGTSAKDIIDSIGDPRIRYFWQEPAGISAARNRAADESVGWFTAVHDDDDIMLPGRLEIGLAAFAGGVDAVYGAWANFDESTGEMRAFLTKKAFGTALNAFSGQGPGHGTWLLPTHLIRRVRYDEGLTSSVDHNLASRLAWHGVAWKHVEDLVFLRRVHAGQISRTESAVQKAGHVLTLFANHLTAGPKDADALRSTGKNLHYPKIPAVADLFNSYGAWLPDTLVRRHAVLLGGVTNKLFDMDMPPSLGYILEERDFLTGRLQVEMAEVNDLSYQDLVDLRRRGMVDIELRAELRVDLEAEASGAETLEPPPPYEQALARFPAIAAKKKLNGCWLVVNVSDTGVPPTLAHVKIVVRVAASSAAGGRVILYGYHFSEFAKACAALVAVTQQPGVLAQVFAPGQLGAVEDYFKESMDA